VHCGYGFCTAVMPSLHRVVAQLVLAHLMLALHLSAVVMELGTVINRV